MADKLPRALPPHPTRLLASRPARIVQLSSIVHHFCPLSLDANFDAIASDPATFNRWWRYGETKCAKMLHAKELDRRLAEQGIRDVYVNSCLPGIVNTDKTKTSVFYNPLTSWAFDALLMTPEQGAVTPMFLASAEEVERGNDGKGFHARYFVPYAHEQNAHPLVDDETLAKRLWAWSERVVQEKLAHADN